MLRFIDKYLKFNEIFKFLNSMLYLYRIILTIYSTNQSGAAEAWWAHNPQVPGSKPGSDREKLPNSIFALPVLGFDETEPIGLIY